MVLPIALGSRTFQHPFTFREQMDLLHAESSLHSLEYGSMKTSGVWNWASVGRDHGWTSLIPEETRVGREMLRWGRVPARPGAATNANCFTMLCEVWVKTQYQGGFHLLQSAFGNRVVNYTFFFSYLKSSLFIYLNVGNLQHSWQDSRNNPAVLLVPLLWILVRFGVFLFFLLELLPFSLNDNKGGAWSFLWHRTPRHPFLLEIDSHRAGTSGVFLGNIWTIWSRGPIIIRGSWNIFLLRPEQEVELVLDFHAVPPTSPGLSQMKCSPFPYLSTSALFIYSTRHTAFMEIYI